MIDHREWAQICAALGHAGGVQLEGAGYVTRQAVLDILKTFAVPGCYARLLPGGGFQFGHSPTGEPPSEPQR